VQHPHKKIIDLRKRASKPLVVQRSERMHRNLLRIEKVKAKSAMAFDLTRKKKKSSSGSIYLPAEKHSPQKVSRLKVVVAALVFVFILNLVGAFGSGKQTMDKTVATAFSGIGDLIIAAESFASGDFSTSQNRFGKAVEVLREAENDLMVLGGAGAVLETQPEKVQAGSRLVSAGKLLASGGERFAEAANEISLALKTWNVRQQAVAENHSVESFSAQLYSPITKILSGISELESAAALLNLVEAGSLPDELQRKVVKAVSELNYFLEVARPIAEALPEIPNLLGDKIPRRYLVLFQNPDEVRPTGGFVGSVGILDLNDGFAKKFEIKDVYTIDGQLTQHISPPEGFGFITGNWGLRDSNYHPDFPTSAEAASLLFEKAGFGSTDGVVAVNASLLEKIAQITGGVKLPRFKEKIEAQDLNLLLEMVIEAKVDGASNPKQILAEVWTELRDSLGRLPQQTLVEIMWSAIEQKEIQFASGNPDLLQVARATGVANELRETDGDYLFVVNTSLGGNKSDKFCDNKITHQTEIDVNGAAINTLTILRKHSWSDSAERKIERLAENFGIPLSDNLKEILGRGRNVDLLKVLVPAGSELIDVEGIPVDRVETKTSAGKTYFMFSLTVQPKFSREVILKYKLPKNFTENYSFLGEFQSGDRTRQIEKIIKKEDVKIFEGAMNLGVEKVWGL
jgi:hypothetical protein